MQKTAFIFAGIMSAIIGTAYATGENTVTSKSYVDAQDALKQDKITAGTTGNVVTYNGEDANGQAQFNEVGIYDGSAAYSNSDADKLVTAEVVHDFAAAVETLTVPDNKLVAVDENGTTLCQLSNSCTLWRISTGTKALTATGTFAPLTAAPCKTYGQSASSDSECCSGVRFSYKVFGMVCGCTSDDNCAGSSQGPVCNTETHQCNLAAPNG